MAPSEHTEAEAVASPVTARRAAVYIVAVLALGVVVWALIEGNERDLWTQPSMIWPAFGAVFSAL